ncbi:fumarylacetoacetate hydrolase family protein [Bacillus sp. FJAT-50079]|uniref:fumarylacetoacetate hydrolase family protein n=1 Tax=Bacillus sp. FJAT-50079 TaxID=2833577 RepID=UPI001BC9922B|nr:fumarylacetoacetate hydrolase family protein [Bacillus sp. FJAT-50079]MBS4210261.1 fumarylacetoacetate hydrolase family protein [Bacillus sp. FJAT-50079]
MKRGRVRYGDAIYEVCEVAGTIQFLDGRLVPEGEVIWLPPVEPETVFALGLNYADHATELEFKPPEEPLIFLKGRNTFIGHHGKTKRPANVTYMHYECELVVIIGKKGKNIKREDAYDYVGGYTIANDYAIRDYLENYYRPNLRVKNRDHTTPIGPWYVHKEDIADPMNLQLQTYVNGELKQKGSTQDMVFDICTLIEYISSFMTLNVNDIILTGTPKGTENVVEGDQVVTNIEGLGSLVNTIVGEV